MSCTVVFIGGKLSGTTVCCSFDAWRVSNCLESNGETYWKARVVATTRDQFVLCPLVSCEDDVRKQLLSHVAKLEQLLIDHADIFVAWNRLTDQLQPLVVQYIDLHHARLPFDVGILQVQITMSENRLLRNSCRS